MQPISYDRHRFPPERWEACRARSSVTLDAVRDLAVLVLALGERITLVAQAGQSGARGMGEPAGRLDQIVEGCPVLPSKKRDDEGLLRTGMRRRCRRGSGGPRLRAVAPTGCRSSSRRSASGPSAPGRSRGRPVALRGILIHFDQSGRQHQPSDAQ